jgi:spermidine synthase
MSTSVMSTSRIAVETLSRPRLMWGVGLVSFSALLLELSLTRLFSVVLFYHFAFLSISVALLGLGAGGVFAYVRKTWLSRFELGQLGAFACQVNALAVLIALEVVLHLRISLNLTSENLGLLTVVYLVSAVPFFLTGVLFSVTFAREPGRISQLYGADLAGGALACLCTVPVLNLIGGPNALLFVSVVSALSSVLWARTTTSRRIGAGIAAIFVVLIVVNHSGKLADIGWAKGFYRDPAYVEYSKWNAISRVEVDKAGNAKNIVIDADASTFLMGVDPTNWDEADKQATLGQAPGVVNALRPKGTYAIIGPGGGVDVLRAVASGSPSVTGIEINPIIANDIMRGRYADYSHHLYSLPQVHMNVSDGRSFIRSSSDRYDVIQMTLVDTWASTAAGAFALSENSLYTVEAFKQYFAHMNPDGMIAITRWEFKQPREALRVVSNAIQALHEIGVADPSHNVIVVSQGQLNTDGIPVLVLAKKSAFTSQEERTVLEHLEKHPPLTLIYSPSDHTRPAGVHPVDPNLRWNPYTALLVSNDPAGFAHKYVYNVSPVYDDAPFFFFTMKLGQIFATADRGIDWKVNLGVAVLLMLLGLSAIAVLAFLILPLALYAPAKSESLVRLLYFVAVGLGYILVEIALIQRFVLFLGHPTYALTVVIFLMLLSSGAGSFLSRRLIPDPQRVWAVAIIIAIAVGLYVLVLPKILVGLVGLPFVAKLLISGGLIIPLGLMMGMPFPTGLRAISPTESSLGDQSLAPTSGSIEWAWAMNAASSVLGSVLAMVVAIQWGLSVTLAAGAVAYVVAAALTPTFRRALSPR